MRATGDCRLAWCVPLLPHPAATRTNATATPVARRRPDRVPYPTMSVSRSAAPTAADAIRTRRCPRASHLLGSPPVPARVLPQWFDDAKLGIFVHWTPASVPAFAPVGPDPFTVAARDGWERAMRENPYVEWY